MALSSRNVLKPALYSDPPSVMRAQGWRFPITMGDWVIWRKSLKFRSVLSAVLSVLGKYSAHPLSMQTKWV